MPCASSSCGGHGAAKRANEAQQLKDAGNELFGAKRYADAVAKYAAAADAAFEADDREIEAIAHSNAAQAHLLLEAYDDAVMAATLALAADPTLGKALVRRAKARAALGNNSVAKEDVADLRRRLPELRGVTEDAVAGMEVEVGIRKAPKQPKPTRQQPLPSANRDPSASSGSHRREVNRIIASASHDDLQRMMVESTVARAMQVPYFWRGHELDQLEIALHHFDVFNAHGDGDGGSAVPERCVWGSIGHLMQLRRVPSVRLGDREYDAAEVCAIGIEKGMNDAASWQMLGEVLRDGPRRSVTVNGAPMCDVQVLARANALRQQQQ